MDHLPLHIQLLGGFLLSVESRPLALPHAPRLEALLAFLVLHRTTPQPRRHIAFCLWPDSSEAQAQTNLRHLLHQLRRLLPVSEQLFCLDGRTLQIRHDAPLTSDVVAFEGALLAARYAQRDGEQALARAALEAAAASYAGDLLPSCYDDWIGPERERLRQDFVAALDWLAAVCEEQRDYPAAIAAARRLLQVEPLRETAQLRLIRLLALTGDRAAALHAYNQCVALLRRELAAEPGAALRETYRRLCACADSPGGEPQPGEALPLVGRGEAWRALVGAWNELPPDRPRLLLLTGEAGVGKTRLAEEFLMWVQRQGMRVARSQCYPGEGDLALSPIRVWLHDWRASLSPATLSPFWLAELGRLTPELGDAPLSPTASLAPEPWQRQQLFEALHQAMLAVAPSVLFLDDLQWCDRASLEWLRYLLRSPSASRLLVLAAMRPEELEPAGTLAEQLADLRALGLSAEVQLAPLNAEETAAFAAQTAGRALTPEQNAAVVAESEGNPLFIIEIVRSLLEPQCERAVGAAASQAAPETQLTPRLQAVLSRRLVQLSPPARELAGAAAALGRPFTVPLLARICPHLADEALVHGLDELVRRRVIRDEPDDSYAFSHVKLREVAYQELSSARRRLLEARVAAALGRQPRRRAGPAASAGTENLDSPRTGITDTPQTP